MHRRIPLSALCSVLGLSTLVLSLAWTMGIANAGQAEEAPALPEMQGQPQVDPLYFSRWHINTVIERTALQKVMQEQALQLTGAIDEKTAMTVGKLAGAEGIVLGAVTASTVEDSGYSEGRSRCVAEDQRGRCTRQQEYRVSCTKRDAYFAFTPKVISVATGQILAAESLTGRSEAKGCQDSGQPLEGKNELLERAKRLAMQKFRELVAPYYMTMEITILTAHLETVE